MAPISGTALRKRAALSRFLEKDADELERMMREDGLPYVNLPGKTKPSPRFFLPDVHEWLCRYAKGDSARVMDFREFLQAFESAQR